jgi:hypothetical protein
MILVISLNQHHHDDPHGHYRLPSSCLLDEEAMVGCRCCCCCLGCFCLSLPDQKTTTKMFQPHEVDPLLLLLVVLMMMFSTYLYSCFVVDKYSTVVCCVDVVISRIVLFRLGEFVDRSIVFETICRWSTLTYWQDLHCRNSYFTVSVWTGTFLDVYWTGWRAAK